MHGMVRKSLRFLFDIRTFVAIFGIALSIITHELLHIAIHWGEIDHIGLFPDRHAIVEIIFEPSTIYNFAVEEGIAYAVTMITLILTAMLIGDISDAQDKRSAQQIIFSKDSGKIHSAAQNNTYRRRLARVLGVKHN